MLSSPMLCNNAVSEPLGEEHKVTMSSVTMHNESRLAGMLKCWPPLLPWVCDLSLGRGGKPRRSSQSHTHSSTWISNEQPFTKCWVGQIPLRLRKYEFWIQNIETALWQPAEAEPRRMMTLPPPKNPSSSHREEICVMRWKLGRNHCLHSTLQIYDTSPKSPKQRHRTPKQTSSL